MTVDVFWSESESRWLARNIATDEFKMLSLGREATDEALVGAARVRFPHATEIHVYHGPLRTTTAQRRSQDGPWMSVTHATRSAVN